MQGSASADRFRDGHRQRSTDALGWAGSSRRSRQGSEGSAAATLASVLSLLEEVARIQKETAELLSQIVHTQNGAAIQRRGKTREPIQRLVSVQKGLPAQPDPGERQPRRPGSQCRPARLAEPLTQHEHAVLRMLTTRLSLREIGQELYVSLNTVKSHTRAIYRKLDVSNRHEAVQRGRELAILPELTSTDISDQV